MLILDLDYIRISKASKGTKQGAHAPLVFLPTLKLNLYVFHFFCPIPKLYVYMLTI